MLSLLQQQYLCSNPACLLHVCGSHHAGGDVGWRNPNPPRCFGYASAGEDIRERTDALDAAGNTTAAIGKGFAIGSAALVSLALFGAYVTRSKIDLIESSILDPKVRPAAL